MQQQPKKLLDQVRDAIRLKNYAYSTEQAYVAWTERFIRFHKLRHPREMNRGPLGAKLRLFLLISRLNKRFLLLPKIKRSVLCFFFIVMSSILSYLAHIDIVWAERDKRIPVVLTKGEVQLVIAQMTGLHQMQAKLLYGSGIRLMECLRLRVKDVDFDRHQIIVRDTKGNEDRTTMLPQSIAPLLRQHLVNVKRLHEADLTSGNGRVELPFCARSQIS